MVDFGIDRKRRGKGDVVGDRLTRASTVVDEPISPSKDECSGEMIEQERTRVLCENHRG